MLDCSNRSERKIFREALVKHFPLDSLKVIKQQGVDVNCDNPTVGLKDYFDDFKNVPLWINMNDLYLKGNNNWTLSVEIDVIGGEVEFKTISNLDQKFNSKIKSGDLKLVYLDPIDFIFSLFDRHTYEWKFANFLYKLCKNANERRERYELDLKLEKLRKDLLS